MSILGRKVSMTAVFGAAALMVFAVLLAARADTPAREITLVARGMAFYLKSDPTRPNPALEVTAGERVRIVLRNEDRGMTHDVAVPMAGAAVELLDWRERGDVTFTVPSTPGIYEYVCRPHELMMRGTLKVVDAPLDDRDS